MNAHGLVLLYIPGVDACKNVTANTREKAAFEIHLGSR